MKLHITNRLVRGISMLFPSIKEKDIGIKIKENKTNYTLCVMLPSENGKIIYKKFKADSVSTLQKEAFDWLRISLYATYRAKKIEYDNSIRRMIDIEKYMVDHFNVNLNPRVQ